VFQDQIYYAAVAASVSLSSKYVNNLFVECGGGKSKPTLYKSAFLDFFIMEKGMPDLVFQMQLILVCQVNHSSAFILVDVKCNPLIVSRLRPNSQSVKSRDG
jgi:hypothetical protein